MAAHRNGASRTVAGFGIVACTLTLACGDTSGFRPLRAGDALPAYVARRLERTDSLALPTVDGRPLLVNVWATWCVPCRTEMPALQQLHMQWEAAGLRVVGINIDTRGNDEPVRSFLADAGVTFPNLRDPEDRVTRVFRLLGVPETLLIDRDGRIVHRWIGAFDPLSAQTAELVRRALDE